MTEVSDDPPRVSVIIPAKNEAKNLREVLPRLPEVHEVILVDGDSVDGTVEVARQLMPDIRVVRQTRRGKGNALVCGFLAARGDIVVMFDADGSADPAEIHRYVQALVDGAQFAKGSRYLPEGGSEDLTLFRSLGNRALNLAVNLLFGTSYTDLCYGYNAFWRDLVPSLQLPHPHLDTHGSDEMIRGDGFEIETMINCRMAKNRVRIVEVPSVEQERIHGVSHLNAVTDGLRVLKTLLLERMLSRSRHSLPRNLSVSHDGSFSPSEAA